MHVYMTYEYAIDGCLRLMTTLASIKQPGNWVMPEDGRAADVDCQLCNWCALISHLTWVIKGAEADMCC